MISLTFGLSLSFFSFVCASALAFGSGFILSYLRKMLQPGGSLHAFLPVRQARRFPPRPLPPTKKHNLQDAHSLFTYRKDTIAHRPEEAPGLLCLH